MMRWIESVRAPAVAGRFYPGDPERLSADISKRLSTVDAPRRAVALVGPHAGWLYSGSILGETYARIHVPSSVVILCPNHTGLGVRRSIWNGGAWRLPSGDLGIDRELAEQLAEAAGLEGDVLAHLREHAIEVHLPFLQALRPDVRIVPVCLGGLDVDACRHLGSAIAGVVAERGGDVLIVASTDMSHYISATEAERLDRLAIARVETLDAEGLHRTVHAHAITMCGYVPTTVALFAARELAATSGHLVRYGNSGERSGDFERVVGYAGFVVA